MAEEKTFENKIKKYLKEKCTWFIKYWGGGAFTKAGIPDLLVCYNGYFIAIEVKANHGKPELIQLVTLKKIRNAGGIGILLYPKDWENFKKEFETEFDLWYEENIELQEQWYNKLFYKIQ